MFAVPAPLDAEGKEVTNEKNIMFLEKIAENLGCEKITADDFEAFLHVLYPLQVFDNLYSQRAAYSSSS